MLLRDADLRMPEELLLCWGMCLCLTLCSCSDWARDEWFSPGSSACYCWGNHWNVWISNWLFFFFVFFNGCSVIRGSDWDPPFKPNQITPVLVFGSPEGAITLSILRNPLGNRIHITLILTCLFGVILTLIAAVLLLSQQDLSLGPLSALCCAPLVEEVLVYCLHDLVKYVYMNDDRLVSTHMIIITLSYWNKKRCNTVILSYIMWSE